MPICITWLHPMHFMHIHTWIDTYIHEYIHKYVHKHIHRYIHKYIHTTGKLLHCRSAALLLGFWKNSSTAILLKINPLLSAAIPVVEEARRLFPHIHRKNWSIMIYKNTFSSLASLLCNPCADILTALLSLVVQIEWIQRLLVSVVVPC